MDSVSTVVFVSAAILVLVVICAMYNTLISLKNKVTRSKSNIDVFLKKRFDLIPNIESAVKGYIKHEKETLEEITRLRNIYETNKDIKTANELNEKITNLIMIAEDNPKLKSSELFLNLQKELADVEDEIQAVRRIYNNSVNIFNTRINQIPYLFLVPLLGYREEEFLKFDTEEIKVTFDK